jgi:putative ubiquitin-RnfH superfamily antitoxin RatB of RatAB toxin-antitoxin module
VADGRIRISVVYAERDRQTLLELEVEPGTTAAEAVARSGIRAQHPGIATGAVLGVWGRIVAPQAPLAAGDRVEIYRPLEVDPKQARRGRARQGRGARPGG